MTSDEFRRLFNRNRMMSVLLANGERTIAVGLDGDQVIVHGGKRIPLAQLSFSFANLQIEQATE